MNYLQGRTAHPPRKASPIAKRKPSRPAIQHRPRVIGLQRLMDEAGDATARSWQSEHYAKAYGAPAEEEH